MRQKFITSLIFLIYACSLTSAREQIPVAKKGVLDLREISDPSSFKMRINGEWEFYWNKMLFPADFQKGGIKPDYYGKVPSIWTDYPQDSVKTEKFGYATYRLTILLPRNYKESLAIELPVINSSYTIYVDGKNMAETGSPGKSEAETKPEYRRIFFKFNPQSDTITISLNVANFHHRRGGFWLPARLGTFSEIQRSTASSWAASWSLISILLGFSLFFLFFTLIAPRDKILGFFSLATLGLAFMPLFTSHIVILDLFNMSWIWVVRFEYLGIYLLAIGWTWFALIQYPSGFIRVLTYCISGFFTITSILTMFLPAKIFSYFSLMIYPVVALVALYLIYKSFLGILNRKRLDLIYFLVFWLLIFGTVHDLRVSQGRAASSLGYILIYLMSVFVFIQAGLILYRWVKTFFEIERLQNELEFMNKNLENIVNERTLQLKTRTLEIENINTRIALQNKQLSETIQLKNKIFSVIAHDLRGPIVNILYMLNLLKEKEYKENYDTYANSSIQYAQNVITLLENMLVWGRDQEDKIKFAPGNRDLAEIILTNMSIFKETGDKKNIVMNFTQVGSAIAFIDKDLLDIVIRNILSNAIKYTPRGGRISILLKDKFQGEKGIMLKICDNGIGIPENKQKNLFSSAEIVSTPGTEDEKGTGLGLKLCYELIRLNNGTISVKSRSGEGTCFIISLPV